MIVVILLGHVQELQDILILHWHVTLRVSVEEHQSVLLASYSIV